MAQGSTSNPTVVAVDIDAHSPMGGSRQVSPTVGWNDTSRDRSGCWMPPVLAIA